MPESAFRWLFAPDPTPADADAAMMVRALVEARRGVGRTAPNPPVGAVVVKDGVVVAVGHHARAGERHAEVVALDQVAGRARGATLYVTLEPCTHHGRTPPCVERVLAEGIARVVVGAVDPNPRVSGGGLDALRAAGVDARLVDDPVVAAQAAALIAPFGTAMTRSRPWVVLKIAATLDGRVASADGRSRWITGAAARSLVHELRDHVDAVLVGSGTVLADDPVLTVRDAPPRGDGSQRRDPRRVVVDGALRCDPRARVFGARSLVLHATTAPADRQRAFDDAGVERVPAGASPVDLPSALAALGARGIHSVLVEAGPRLAAALVQAQLVDELWWLSAPTLLGGDAVPAVGPLGIASPAELRRMIVVGARAFGDGDHLRVLVP
ncbi:MAG: bifunctional diaminohydroxyphosphoribosylaminopyrimidine deaminase/5-amino-6-(5-phosphoribosylamino)uracil reductase RibD [Deltaproteobacteria bacterium]|nr:bifunctional diaminohydroxyphosphoribosylaminopyrimidine deaminase/5-amino-6-(5-phosphoribosylamino)uracil reductase RibD [Deltaproteobacteria bacterium]